MRSLTNRIKKKEIVILPTDKSGRHSVDWVDTPENYRLSVQKHIRNNEVINEEIHSQTETVMNAHAYMGKNTKC